jgi:hypothetical protein
MERSQQDDLGQPAPFAPKAADDARASEEDAHAQRHRRSPPDPGFESRCTHHGCLSARAPLQALSAHLLGRAPPPEPVVDRRLHDRPHAMLLHFLIIGPRPAPRCSIISNAGIGSLPDDDDHTPSPCAWAQVVASGCAPWARRITTINLRC